jgi:hypothetical protein
LNVCSIIGKSEITRAIDFSGNNEFEIDISWLEHGTYIEEVKSDQLRLTSKFIKD